MFDFLSQTATTDTPGMPWWGGIVVAVLGGVAARSPAIGRWVLQLVKAGGDATAVVRKAESSHYPAVAEGWHEAVESLKRANQDCEERSRRIEAKADAAERECRESTAEIKSRLSKLEKAT